MPKSIFKGLDLDLPYLRRFLTPETLQTLRTEVAKPTMAELEDLGGQRGLPLDNGEAIDFPPAQAVREQRAEQIVSPFSFLPQVGKAGGGQETLPLGYPADPKMRERTLQPGEAPAWEPSPRPPIDQNTTRLQEMATIPWQASESGAPELDASGKEIENFPYGMVTAYMQGQERAAARPAIQSAENTDLLSESEWKRIYGEGGADPVSAPTARPGTPEDSAWAAADYNHRMETKRLLAEHEAYGQAAYDRHRGPGAWEARRQQLLLRPMASDAQLSRKAEPADVVQGATLEEATRVRQDPRKLPVGHRYEDTDVPGEGLGAPGKRRTMVYPPAVPTPVGTAIFSLRKLTRAIADVTGIGQSNIHMRGGQPWDDEIEMRVRDLVDLTEIDREALQTVYDRLVGTYFRDPLKARTEFGEFLSTIYEKAQDAVIQGRDPKFFGQSAFAQRRYLVPGAQAEGFEAGGKILDTDAARAQLYDEENMNLGEAFRGQATNPEDREAFAPTSKTLSVEERYLAGQQPLSSMRRDSKGWEDDQVENLRKGLTDVAIVERGSVGKGLQLLGDRKPLEAMVTDVIPLRKGMGPGYLEELSRRSGIPFRTLQAAADVQDAEIGTLPLDIIQISPQAGKTFPPLVPENRWRTEDSLRFVGGKKAAAGAKAKARLTSTPQLMEILLTQPGARGAMSLEGPGSFMAGVVIHKGKPIAFGPPRPDGTIPKYKLHYLEDGRLAYNGKAFSNNLFEGRGTRPVLESKMDLETGKSTERLRSEQALALEGLPEDPKRRIGEGFSPGVFKDDKTASRGLDDTGRADFEAGARGPRLQRIPGVTLSATPLKTEISSVKGDPNEVRWALASQPEVYADGRKVIADKALPVANDPSKADLVVVFTQRKPTRKDRYAHIDYEAGQKELVNPTPEQLRAVLLHSAVKNVAVKFVTEGQFGPAKALVARGKAVIQQAKSPRALAKGSGLEIMGRLPNESTRTGTNLGMINPRSQAPTGTVGPLGNRVETDPAVLDRLRQQAKGIPPTREFKPEKPGEVAPPILPEEPEARRAAIAELHAQRESKQGEAAAGRFTTQFQRGVNKKIGKMLAVTSALGDRFPDDFKKNLGMFAVIGMGGLIANAFGGGEAEASTKSLMDKHAATEAIREAGGPEGFKFSNPISAGQEKLTNFWETIYDTFRQLGVDHTGTRDLIQREDGGVIPRATARNREIAVLRKQYESAGKLEEFKRYLMTEQGLWAWDLAERKRDQFLEQAALEDARGNTSRAQAQRALAQELDNRMAKGELVEGGANKEQLMGDLQDLHDLVGPEVYFKMQEDANVLYAPVQKMLDDMHTEGITNPVSYQEFKARGADYLPSWKTDYSLDPESGQVVWKGGKPLKIHSTTQQGIGDELIQPLMGSTNVLKDPFSNVGKFLAEGEREIARTRVADDVIGKLAKVGKATLVQHPESNPKAGPGMDFYTYLKGGKPVTYELPEQVVRTLMRADNYSGRTLLGDLPGQKAISLGRSISEVGVTTANLGGWLFRQAFLHDPIAAITQLPSEDQKVARRVLPFFKTLIKEAGLNYATKWGGREWSPLRRKAHELGVLHSGITSRHQGYDQVEGRDTQKLASKAWAAGKPVEAGHHLAMKALNLFSDYLAQPYDEANKMASLAILLNEGVEEGKAASEARRWGGSPDWHQKGSADQWVRGGLSFFRPKLLGLEAAAEAAPHNKRKLMKLMGGMAAVEGMRQLANAKASNELEMSNEELEGLYSEYDQDSNYLFMVPPSAAKAAGWSEDGLEMGSNGSARPFAMKIPIPMILRTYATPFRGIYKAIREGRPMDAPLETGLAVADELLPGSVPLKKGNLVDSGKRRLIGALPAPYRIPLEQGLNIQSYTGAPIVGSRLEGLPAEDQWSSSTEPFYKDLGRTLGASPARLQHVGKSALPGVFSVLQDTYNLAAPTPKDDLGKEIPEVEQSAVERAAKLPILGGIVRGFTPQRYEEELGDAQDQFYDLSERSKAAAGQWNRYEQGLTSQAPSKEIENLSAYNKEINGIVRELAQINQDITWVENTSELNSHQKAVEKRKLVAEKRELLRSFLRDPEIGALTRGGVPAR